MSADLLIKGAPDYSGYAIVTGRIKAEMAMGATKTKLSEAQIVLRVRNNVALCDWDEYVHMRLLPVKKSEERIASLRNHFSRRGRFMTFRTGLYFLWTGLVLLTVSGIGTVLTANFYT